jgi:Translation initiation factor IF-3, N-terminal domain
MDLVEVDPRTRPAVCKLLEAGKAAYQAAQKDKVTKPWDPGQAPGRRCCSCQRIKSSVGRCTVLRAASLSVCAKGREDR